MIPLIGAAVSGALNLAGDIFTQTTARSAYKSRYQDEVNDLRKAGLNPALAYGANPGNPNTATFSGLGDTAMSGYQAAQQAKEAAARTDLTSAQANLLKAQTADLIDQVKIRNQDIGEHARLTASQAQVSDLEQARRRGTIDADISSAKTAAELARLNVPEAKANARYYASTVGRLTPYINTATDVVGSLIGAIRGLRVPNYSTTINVPRRP